MLFRIAHFPLGKIILMQVKDGIRRSSYSGFKNRDEGNPR